MKFINPSPVQLRSVVAALLASVLALGTARATPYATSLTNNAGTVSFRLNEAADAVFIIGNAGTLVTNIGPRSAGLTVTNLAAKGLTNGIFQVDVRKSGSNVIAQVGATISANSPRGVDVNVNPASPYFGRIYMANSANGTLGDGIYIYNPDFSNPFGSATNLHTTTYDWSVGGSSAPMHLKVGADDQLYIGDWSDASGNLVTTDPDVTTFTYVLQQLSAPGAAAVPVGSNNVHGSVYSAVAVGSLAAGNLKVYTMDEDYQQDPASPVASQLNSIWEYDIGSGPLPWTNAPNRIICIPNIATLSQNGDLAIGPTGFLYVDQRRANAGNLPSGTWSPSLMVVDPSHYIDPTNFAALYDPTNLPGVPNPDLGGLYTLTSNYVNHVGLGLGGPSGGYVWESQSASADLGSQVADLFGEANGVSVSPDGKWVAVITFGALNGLNPNQVKVAALTNGIPDMARFWTFATGSATSAGRGVAWDRADNLYVVSSGGAYLKQYTLGFTSKAITGSDGTFSLTLPTNEVSVFATDAIATEGTPATDTATFTFSRDGDVSSPLTVSIAMSGTASNGVDYVNAIGGAAVGNTITFAAGAAKTNLTLVPVDDTIAESPETIIVTVQGRTNYTTLANTATAVIADNEPATVTLAGTSTNMYERVSADFVRFTLARLGQTNNPVTVNIAYTGTAVDGVDFQDNGNVAVTLNAGQITKTFDLNPIDNSLVDGTRVGVATIAAPSTPGDYVIGATSNVVFQVVDDDLPTETVLYSEDFDAYLGLYATNTAPPAWDFKFAANNANLADYNFTFGYDYSADGIPAPPNTATTYGLKATVNKYDATAAAAALNFYPASQSFTGNYALRFEMLMVVGTVSGTEHAIFGVDHSGTKTNWFRSGGVGNGAATNQDGEWFAVGAINGNNFDYTLWNNTNGTTPTNPNLVSNRVASTTMQHFFKTPVYNTAGSPGSTSGATGTKTWVDVEVAHTTNMVILRIDGIPVIETTNVSGTDHGNIMIGYEDGFDSIGDAVNANVYYDNVRVVSISPPVITTQPVGQSAPIGGSVTLTVAATTSTSVTNYQWFRNGAPVANATNASLTLSPIAATNYGTYTVVVDDGRFPVISSPAVVSPTAGPVIVTPPANRAAIIGSTPSPTFSVVASTSTTATNYQWNFNGSPIAGRTAATLTVTNIQAANFGNYSVTVGDGFTTVTSANAALTQAVSPTATPSLSGTTMTISFGTEVGPRYVVEYKTNLTDANWIPLSTNNGTGGVLNVNDSSTAASSRFYRVRLQ